jgi:dihydroflavonol-4-reductase
VYIDDLIRGTLLCLERGRKGEIYHLAGPEVLTVKEMVNMIAAALDTRIPRLALPSAPVKILSFALDKAFSFFKNEAPLTPAKLSFFLHPKPLAIEKAKTELGYNPQVDFEKGMKMAVAWYRQAGWLPAEPSR